MDHVLYALLWASFGAGHTLLAGPAAKRRLEPVLGRWYRLAYNAFSGAHLGAVLGLGRVLYAGRAGFDPPGWLVAAGYVLALIGAVVIVVALAGYDRGRFLGTRQVADPEAAADEELRLDGLHLYVRHPLYAGLFLLLWGLAQSPFALATAVWGSVYIVLGTVSEERKLVELYGARYEDYRRCMPAFFPRLLRRARAG